MRIRLQLTALAIFTFTILGLGFWARHKAMLRDLDAAFTATLFSPIRTEYPSIVSPEQEAVIQRREQELILRSEAEARRWRALAFGLFAGSILSCSGTVVLGSRVLKKRREKHS